MPPIKLDIVPVPKPRMVKSDSWAKRPEVLRYWDFKSKLIELYGDRELPESIGLVFIIPMPISWSEKKKALHDGKPHQVKGDIDNYIKATLDCLADNDAYIWRVDAVKRWGREGSITISNLGENI
jgi:Holliday junction resolvase RusA-like endonuclease